MYVQNLIEEDKEFIGQALSQSNSYLFISGSAKRMPADVKEALVNILVEVGIGTEKAAKLLLQQMERKGRLKIEAWS